MSQLNLDSPHTHFSFLDSPSKLLLFAILITLSIKLLLIPTYHSTDLEVHRNWLTLRYGVSTDTGIIPIPYFDSEECSQHTLDYPMLFYYFQYAMSLAYEVFFSILDRMWIRRLWKLAPNDAAWRDWKFWGLKQDETVRILSAKENQCQGHSYIYAESDAALHPFENLKALLLERRSHVSVQYPLPLLFVLRMSVILSDVVLYVALFLLFVRGVSGIGAHTRCIAKDFRLMLTAGETNRYQHNLHNHHLFKCLILFLLHPSLLYLDHVHFQYNGMLIGMLLLSMYLMMQRRYVTASVVFTVLLCFKHLYVYVLPAYIVMLLFFYVFSRQTKPDTKVPHDRGSSKGPSPTAQTPLKTTIGNVVIALRRLMTLTFATALVPLLSLLPILYMYQGIYSPVEILVQIKERLFPFHRGLTHAYWAPNVWALYNGADKVLSTLLRVQYSHESVANLTGGLVGTDQGTHLVLPTIRPLHTLLLSALFSFLIPSFVVLSKRNRLSSSAIFLKACFHSTMAFFMFGWHVHEKAIVTAFVPLFLYDAYCFSRQEAHLSQLFEYIGTYSLLPLLFRTQELSIKYALFVTFYCLKQYLMPVRRIGKLEQLEYWWCIVGSVNLEVFQQVLHPLIFGERMAFLPLMLVSMYCSTSVLYLWVRIMLRDLS